MAEEIKNSVVDEVEEQASTPDTNETTEKTFTQAEVTEMIQQNVNRAVAKAHKEAEEKMAEAEKLRKMNAEQKAEYEAKKKDDYIADLEAKINRSGLEKEASKLLSESGIVATDQVLDFVVRTTAEDTLEAVKNFTALVEVVANAKVQEALKGKTPARAEHGTSGGVTKGQFNKMSYAEQLKLYQEDPQTYQDFTK